MATPREKNLRRLPPPLPRRFFLRPTLQVARDLVGCLVVHRVRGRDRIVRIVETEAYVGPKDRACHASRGLTDRTAVMFGPAGHAYVFFVYGMHHCLNVVTEREGFPAAVLIRAAEPVSGVWRKTDGPGRLTAALGIDRRHDGCDLCRGGLYLSARDRPVGTLSRSARIGVDYAGPWARKPWRFFEQRNPHVSRGDGVKPHRRRGRKRT